MTKKSTMKKAEQDFKFLLDRGYKRKSALNFVVAHYGLGRKEKNFLLRRVFSREEIREHKKKLISLSASKNKKVAIDTYNVLITVGTILAGNKRLLVKGMDGFLRDAKGIFSNYKFNEKTERALKEILGVLQKYHPKYLLFVLDSQISRSGELADYIRKQLKKFKLEGEAKTKRSADSFLVKKNWITSTSDTAIIEKVDKVIDIGAGILKDKR